MKSKDQTSPVLTEAQTRTRMICHAFRQVFGRPGDANRTPQQKAVWETLEALCFQDRSTFPATHGPKDALSAAINEGYRLCFLQMREFVNQDFDEAKAPPEVIK